MHNGNLFPLVGRLNSTTGAKVFSITGPQCSLFAICAVSETVAFAGRLRVHDARDGQRRRGGEQGIRGRRRITRTIFTIQAALPCVKWFCWRRSHLDRRNGPILVTGGAMISTRVGLQAAVNGDRTKATHPATPLSVEELAQDAAACVAAGARAIHLHPRDPERRETLDAGIVDEVVTKVREACGVPVGVTTSAEIEPDPERRLELVRAWRAPDYASVNVSETGAAEIMEILIGAGIGIETGVWTVKDVEWLAASGLGDRPTRILVETGELQLLDSEDRALGAIGLVEDIHEALDRFGLTAPRLQHGDGEVTWALLADAIRRGLDTRIGLEDTLHCPNGDRTSGNEALVRAARELGAGTD